MLQERRRSPRYDIETGELAVMPVSISVLILDISPGGALLQATQSVKVGSRGQLKMSLGREPFAAEVEVRRIAPGVGAIGHRIGVMFLDLSVDCRGLITRFVEGRA